MERGMWDTGRGMQGYLRRRRMQVQGSMWDKEYGIRAPSMVGLRVLDTY